MYLVSIAKVSFFNNWAAMRIIHYYYSEAV